MNSTKYSIIIPTRDRAETLKYALLTCVSEKYENLDIIVSDNCSEDNTEDVVKSFKDSRVKYVKTPTRVSMSENFEYGLSFVTEGYAMVIGDDDGVLPGAIEYVDKIVKETGARAIVSAIAQYVWPNHADEKSRNLMLWSVRNDVEIRKTEDWLRKMLDFELTYTFDLPGIYCGFVHIEIIKSMKKNGCFFLSQTPDAYSAFACALALDTYAFSHRPFSIHGASGRSNGASYLSGKNKDESKRFFKENTIPFHPKLSLCPSFRMIAAEAFLQLKENFPEKTNSYQIDYYKLLSQVRTEKNEYNKDMIEKSILEVCEKNNLDITKIKKIRKNNCISFLGRVLSFLKRMKSLNKYSSVSNSTKIGVYNVYDSSKAMAAIFGVNDGFVQSNFKKILKKFYCL